MIRIADGAVQPFEQEHIAKVRAIGPECVVLLKNEGVLPLGETRQIALYGSGARKTIKGGTGSGDVNVRHFVTIEEGLRNAGVEITSSSWLDAYDEVVAQAKAVWMQDLMEQAQAMGLNPIVAFMGKVMPEPEYELPLDAPGDTAVYVLSRISGEGSDRQPAAGDIDLTATEIRDILALNERYERFVLVLNVGGMVNLEPVAPVRSILLLSQLGTPTGDICADVLLGKASPSGKLAMTWAPIDRYASTKGFGDPNDTLYQDGIYVGYRYFDTAAVTPTYPFGYGLSYTTFEITPRGFAADETSVSVTAVVRNTGSRSGKESVQVYYSAPDGTLPKPYQELAGYEKTGEIAPGEEEIVTVSFATASMASYSEEKAAWILEEGDYVIRVGSSSLDTGICGAVRLDGTAVVSAVRNICPVSGLDEIALPTPAAQPLPSEVPTVCVQAAQIASEKITYRGEPQEIPAGGRVDWSQVKSGEASIDAFLGGLTDDELATVCIGNYDRVSSSDIMSVIGSACTLIAGGAGETTGQLQELHLDALSMTDGPAGIRVSTEYTLENGKPKSAVSSLSLEGMETAAAESQAASSLQEPEQEDTHYYQYCTAIPIGTALAQSFNPETARICGDLVGEEMEMFGAALWLAPALNIQRSPLCGRNFEYFSEDPLVSGKVAAAITRGVQSHKGCGTTIKHFAANNQETNRYTSNSVIGERALREIYLKGFEIAVKESAPEAIMTSYNLLNGEHACNSRDLLTAVLRDEWAYQGMVMTDWYVTTKMMYDPRSLHPEASAAGCVRAGNNVTMSGMPSDREDIEKALENAEHPYPLNRAYLQECAKPVLEEVLRLAQ